MGREVTEADIQGSQEDVVGFGGGKERGGSSGIASEMESGDRGAHVEAEG